ncbi:MAG: glycosyltransferase [Fusobacteriaceae bacterium]
MKKKILIIHYRMDNPGGTERVVANLANSWIKNYDVDLVSVNYKECFYEIDKNVGKYFFNYKLPTVFNNAIFKKFGNLYKFFDTGMMIRKICKKNNYDYIYTPYLTMSLLGYFFKDKKSKQLSAEHASFTNGNSKLQKKIKKIIYKKIDKIILLTDQEKEIYQKMGCNISVVPNATSYYSEETAELNNKKIIMVGRFVDEKNYPEFLNNLNFFEKYPEWKLNIYGNGPHEERMKDIIRNKKISKYVEIKKSVANIKEKYLESSMLVLASKTEGFGMVIIEAMCSGVPCISFNCPVGPAKLIKNNEDGILVQNQNYEELNEKIELLIKYEDVRKKLGMKAKENIKRYSSEEIQKVWDKVFEEVSQN